jgi:N-acetylneuraminic acid mutarotase
VRTFAGPFFIGQEGNSQHLHSTFYIIREQTWKIVPESSAEGCYGAAGRAMYVCRI